MFIRFSLRRQAGMPRPRILFASLFLLFAASASTGAESIPGASVESLLDYARQHNAEYASMRHEADAANERIQPAGALPDPKLRVELQDITMFGEQSPTLLPNRVGKTRYQVTQDLPWFGKRDLQREIAGLEAQGAKGKAQGTWSELSSRIKGAYARLYFLHQNEGLTREILDLMARLEKVTQARYAGGLAAQADAIRAQTEQTAMRNELIALESDKRMTQARLNMLLSRPAYAPLAAPEKLRPLPTPAQLDPAALEDRVRGRNPQLFAEDARIGAAEKSRELAYKKRYPDFALGIAPVQYRNSIKEWEVMIEMNIPLQQESRRSQEREAEAMLSAARARKEATANQLLSDLAENLAALDAARRTEASIDTGLLPQAELTFKSALAGYENGKVDFSAVLDAQRQIRQARLDRIKAQAEAQARLAEVERILGEE